MRLTFGRRRFVWPFLLAAVRFPIIGMDFLKHFRLLVDPSKGVLLDSEAATVDAAEPTTPPPLLQVTTCGLQAPTTAPVGVGSKQLTAAAAAETTSSPQRVTAAAGGKQIPALLRARYAAVFSSQAADSSLTLFLRALDSPPVSTFIICGGVYE
jgi:hypothetical protein